MSFGPLVLLGHRVLSACIDRVFVIRHFIDTAAVTVSPKFQVVIPHAFRAALQLRAGDKLRVVLCADRLQFIPVRPIQQMRGFLRGMNTIIERETDCR